MAENDKQVHIECLGLAEGTVDPRIAELFARYECTHMQQGAGWLENLASQALDESDEAVVLLASNAGGDLVACPVKLQRSRRQCHALANFYSTHYSPLLDAQEPAVLLAAIFRHLADTEDLVFISFAPMDAATPEFTALREGLVLAGWRGIHNYFCFGNWTHDTGGAGYAQYLESRPSRLRNTITRKTRKFLQNGRGEFDIIRGGAGLEDAIGDFVAVYGGSWKQQEPYPGFIPGLLRMAAERGWLRLGFARHDGQPVACQVWFVDRGTASIFKLAYREEFASLSPGTVLTAHMMEHVMDIDGVERIDYLSGDDPYKRDWMSARGERQGIAAYNPRTAGGLGRLLAHRLGRLVRAGNRG